MPRILFRALILVVVGILVLVVLNRRYLLGLWQYGGQAREGSLKVGDGAPDVTLWELDGTTTTSLLSRVQVRPLVLVFGSFT